ncbi:hypothetical protein [Hydrogenibacillus schlegelii]|uniref:hypothetical protein n=1 Tax=Hydrogenibacillus schlegelii TaxID=1484 RepID=UPI00349FFA6D
MSEMSGVDPFDNMTKTIPAIRVGVFVPSSWIAVPVSKEGTGRLKSVERIRRAIVSVEFGRRPAIRSDPPFFPFIRPTSSFLAFFLDSLSASASSLPSLFSRSRLLRMIASPSSSSRRIYRIIIP